MLIRGECLISTVTLNFSIHGEHGDGWRVTVSGPDGITSGERETDAGPYELLDELIDSVFKTCCRRFPDRVPHAAARRPTGNGAKR
jgi:hypothetical protein